MISLTPFRPFKCTLCGYAFNRNSTLKQHMKTHTGEKPFRCGYPQCFSSFSENSNLKKHIKSVHEKKTENNNLLFGKEFYNLSIVSVFSFNFNINQVEGNE